MFIVSSRQFNKYEDEYFDLNRKNIQSICFYKINSSYVFIQFNLVNISWLYMLEFCKYKKHNS